MNVKLLRLGLLPGHFGMLFIFLATQWALECTTAAGFDQTHALYARVLSNFVSNGQVDYAQLKSGPEELDAYLNNLAAVRPEDFTGWPRENRLALLLNLYDARTLRLIIDHYPLKTIRDIGVLPGAAWRQLLVRFGGQLMTLSHLENDIIRAEYREPRIHFALVCAALGCPILRSEPYTGDRLAAQLDDQANQFLRTPERNRFDSTTGILWLSPIFKWYKDDFTDSAGSLSAYVKPFLPKEVREAIDQSSKVQVRYTEYDWRLNERSR
jgi:hypothetical protein